MRTHKVSISLTPWGLVKSFTSNRKARCNNCFFDNQGIAPGSKRITLSKGLGINARTLYLCPTCAQSEVEGLERLAGELRRAIDGWVDTEAEWYARRDAV